MMTTCPQCGAAIEPFLMKCPYCGTYYFDLEAWDLEDGHPCFVKFKTPHGTITALAKPRLETAERYSVMGDAFGISKVMTGCDINVRFECQPGENGELFRINDTENA